jgi:hypothetical protein
MNQSPSLFPSLHEIRCNCCLYGVGLNDLDAGKYIQRAIEKGWDLKITTFWALK